MIDFQALQLALRTQALTMSAATTGSATLGATGSTYTRATGSFITDGFAVGMEVAATGFATANNTARVVTGVAALTLTVDAALSTQTASASRVVLAGLPSGRAWENVQYDPTPGDPWIEEALVPGPTYSETLGSNGTLVAEPIYQMTVHAPEGTGVGAINGYTTALITCFKPGTQIVLSNGDTAEVRRDTGPFRTSTQRIRPGWVTAFVSFPLRLYTTN